MSAAGWSATARASASHVARMTPHRLAELIVANIGKEADWGLIPTNGAAVAASLVLEAAETAHAAAA